MALGSIRSSASRKQKLALGLRDADISGRRWTAVVYVLDVDAAVAKRMAVAEVAAAVRRAMA